MNPVQPRRTTPPPSATMRTRRRTLLLGGIAIAATLGTLFSKKLLGVSFSSHGYKKDFEFIYTAKDTGPNATSIARTGDDGYVFSATASVAAEAFLAKINRQGHEQWSLTRSGSDRRSEQTANSVLVDGDNGYWLLGNTNSHDIVRSKWDELEQKDISPFYKHTPRVALVTRVSPDGTVAGQKAYGSLNERESNDAVYCVASANGLIVFGESMAQLPGASPEVKVGHTKVPWIFKISETGEKQWEFLIQQDQNKLIKLATGSSNFLSKPFVDQAGNIVFAVAIEDIKSESDPAGREILDPFVQGINPRTLLIKISGEGKEIARHTLHSTSALAVLVPSKAGCDVFVTDDDSAFSHILFDADLVPISTRQFAGEQFLPVAAIPGPEDGFHLFGNSFKPGHDTGRAVLMWLDRNGILKHQEHFERQSWPSDMAIGENANEVVVLFTSLIEHVVKVVKYTLKSWSKN